MRSIEQGGKGILKSGVPRPTEDAVEAGMIEKVIEGTTVFIAQENARTGQQLSPEWEKAYHRRALVEAGLLK